MLLMVFGASLGSGLSVVFLKLIGELVQSSEFTESWLVPILCVIGAALPAIAGIH